MFTKRKIKNIIYSEWFSLSKLKGLFNDYICKDKIVWLNGEPYNMKTFIPEEIRIYPTDNYSNTYISYKDIEFNSMFEPHTVGLVKNVSGWSSSSYRIIFYRNVCIQMDDYMFAIYTKNANENWLFNNNTGIKNKTSCIFKGSNYDTIQIEYQGGKLYNDDVYKLLKFLNHLWDELHKKD